MHTMPEIREASINTHLATSSIPCLNLSINAFASLTILSAVPLKTGGAIGGFFKFSGAMVDVVSCRVYVWEPTICKGTIDGVRSAGGVWNTCCRANGAIT